MNQKKEKPKGREEWRIIRVSEMVVFFCTEHKTKKATHVRILDYDKGIVSIGRGYCGECLIELVKTTLPHVAQLIIDVDTHE